MPEQLEKRIMHLTGIHHHSVPVQDMERAVAFYRDVLGLTEIAIPSTFPAAGLHVRWFQIGTQQIHLMPAKEREPPSPRHIALAVENAQAARTFLQGRGIQVDEATPIPGADRFFIADPDGNRIELIEWESVHG